jgi:hypothetical protein
MKENFIAYMKQHFTDWTQNGFCSAALELNKKIGEDYFSVANPHFFTGNLDSDLVLVHLNPKISDQQKVILSEDQQVKKPSQFNSFDDYLNYYSIFGKIKYGIEGQRVHKSPFDHKQVRFLKPFELIPLNSSDKYLNLENVIDKKLQLELIPFGSKDFNFRKVGADNLEPFIIPLLKLIGSKDRKYIIFCGRVFERLLDKYIVQKNRIKFKLKKKDGSLTNSDFEVINLKLSIDNQSFVCAIAPQFAKQGYPVEEYGHEIRKFYGNLG